MLDNRFEKVSYTFRLGGSSLFVEAKRLEFLGKGDA